MLLLLSGALACLIIYVLLQIARTKRLIRIGASLAATARAFSQHPAHPRLRILLVGDSTGVGTGASHPNYSIAGRVGERYPDAELTNLSVNGSKTHDVARQLDQAVGPFDLVMIHVGGNDAVRFTNLIELDRDLQRILDLASKKSRRILVTSTGNIGTAPLFPAAVRWLLQRQTLKVRAMFIKRITARASNVRYTDLYRAAAHDPFAQAPKKYYAADFFHPSDAGYEDWFRLIEHELYQLLDEKSTPQHSSRGIDLKGINKNDP